MQWAEVKKKLEWTYEELIEHAQINLLLTTLLSLNVIWHDDSIKRKNNMVFEM